MESLPLVALRLHSFVDIEYVHPNGHVLLVPVVPVGQQNLTPHSLLEMFFTQSKDFIQIINAAYAPCGTANAPHMIKVLKNFISSPIFA